MVCIISPQPQGRHQVVWVCVGEGVWRIHAATHHHGVHCPVITVSPASLWLPPPYTPTQTSQWCWQFHPHISEATNSIDSTKAYEAVFQAC